MALPKWISEKMRVFAWKANETDKTSDPVHQWTKNGASLTIYESPRTKHYQIQYRKLNQNANALVDADQLSQLIEME